MASAQQVASYILSLGPRSALGLQKLLYYAQAWSLVWEQRPLFSEGIRAWDMGPVVGEVWFAQRSGTLQGDGAALTSVDRATVDVVVAYYGAFSGERLSELSHRERPWADAYKPGARPSPLISHAALRDYYARAVSDAHKRIPEAYQRGVELAMSLSPDELADLADDADSGASLDAEIARLGGDATTRWPG